ncbi:PAS domain-containing sensor histidine kinase [Flavobacterium sp.]|uniref:PAS domain-containing sensor histidine kinase n=1 Tax=Flavobacterium sp. TaxID=239 RepID=UPI002610C92C|nr:PAS domain-containing sensor histidine kinase [Flavobacterium sp.]
MFTAASDLKISRTDLQKVADFLPYPFIIAEDFGDTHLNTYLNEKFLEEIGYSLDEIPTIDTWYEKGYPDETYRNQVISNWNQAEIDAQNEHKVFVKMKSQVTCKNGHKRWYEIKASVISKIHVVAFVDVDKEVILQEELRNINRNNDRMLSILGHDLRSPVANLMAISSMAANTELTNYEFTTMMHQINDQSVQVLELLDRTLRWAKLNFNTMQQKSEAIDFKNIISNVLEIHKATHESKKIAIKVQIESAQTVVSDPELVTIIIRNIISNAIKFTPNKGTIAIKLHENELQISDNGIGMTPQMMEEILTNTNISRRGTNNEIGIGMGLQLVKSLTEKINCGFIIVSEPDIGTTIRLVF